MERTSRRRRWRPWEWSTRMWVTAVLLYAALTPLTIRLFILWQVPNVTLPFDVKDVIVAKVPEGEDAVLVYARLAPMLRGRLSAWTMQSIDSTLKGLDQRQDELDQWLLENQPVLELYCRAGEMERAGGPSLATADHTMLLPLHNEFRNYAAMAEAEAVRLERAGDFESAWKYHRANLRCALHAEVPGFPICRLVGNGVRAFGGRGIARWSQQPALSRERLRLARDEVIQEAARRRPVLDLMKADYLAWQNTLRRADAVNHLIPHLPTASPHELLQLNGKRFLLWTLGQPEYALRLQRQLLLNQSEQLDVPLHLRAPTLPVKTPLIYRETTGKKLRPGQMTAEELQRALSTPLSQAIRASGILMGMDALERGCRADDALLAALAVVLAAQEFQRDRDEFPAALEDLVPDYLDQIPLDPMSETGAELSYRRRNGEAVVWSFGMNELDDDGRIDAHQDNDIGYRIQLAARKNFVLAQEPADESAIEPHSTPEE